MPESPITPAPAGPELPPQTVPPPASPDTLDPDTPLTQGEAGPLDVSQA